MSYLRNLLKGISLTGALFVFQACYGTGPALNGDGVVITFHVTDSSDKDVPGAEVCQKGEDGAWEVISISGADGIANIFYNPSEEGEEFRIRTDDGKLAPLDTLLTELSDGQVVEISLKANK